MDQDYEQLMLLKELTRSTGMLHDAQILQLKFWPLILTHAIESEFIFNYDSKEVIYNLKQTKGKTPIKFKNRLKMLGQYTQNLLGTEYSITVKIKGTTLYKLIGISNVRRNSKQNNSNGKGRIKEVEKGK